MHKLRAGDLSDLTAFSGDTTAGVVAALLVFVTAAYVPFTIIDTFAIHIIIFISLGKSCQCLCIVLSFKCIEYTFVAC